MKVHRLTGSTPPDLAAALAEFEAGFRYPLGPGRWFRISHGEDYSRFFRAVGPGGCFIAEEEDGLVLGSLAVAMRSLATPAGAQIPVAYLADLKIIPAARGGFVLRRLAREAEAAIGAAYRDLPATPAAFAVVMEGTAAVPPAYTDRAGIPAFAELGRVAVLRIPTEGTAAPEDGTVNGTEVLACYRRLSRGRYAGLGGSPDLRSATEPAWLATPDGSACGMLEDTHRAKRLLAEDGSEMLSAHLSYFAFADPASGLELLRIALGHAAARRFPALFVAVCPTAVRELCAGLGPGVVVAPAVVFGAGLEPGREWHINTSEI